MSNRLETENVFQSAFVLLLCFASIKSTFSYPPNNRRDNAPSQTFALSFPSTGALGQNAADTPGDSCAIHILFFGIVPYWMEVSRRKRWVRNVLEGTRVSCYEEPCTVRVSYTKTPQAIVKANVVIFANTSPEWLTSEVWDSLVELRPPGQKWVMSTQESPPYVPGLRPPEIHRHASYDWTNSYRADATFPEPYGHYRPFDPSDNQEHIRQHRLEALIRGKKKSVAWISSHCNSLEWDRTGFVKALREHISIDAYGECGDTPLPWKRRDVLRKDMEPYTFYLSLENSCCDQYITEKFWKSLDFGVIPVVVGAPLKHYLDVAPPDSFIHVDQFESLEEMADYMIEVSQSPSKMRKHLKWRLEGRIWTEELWDHILKPMANPTLCSMAKKFKEAQSLDDDLRSQGTFDFYGATWEESCHSCASKPWMEPYSNRLP